MNPSAINDYIQAGLSLIPIPAIDGQPVKGPRAKGWNLPKSKDNPNGYSADLEDLIRRTRQPGSNLGLALEPSKVAAIDLDDIEIAREALALADIDLDALMSAPDAVKIIGREGRGKLLYRVPEGLDCCTCQLKFGRKGEEQMIFELRFKAESGGTHQDVLPPSTHPETGRPYELQGDIFNIPMLPQELVSLWEGWEAWKPVLQTLDPAFRESIPKATPKATSTKWEVNPIDAFNEFHSIHELLIEHEYTRKGRRYLRKGSESGEPGIVFLDEQHIYSHGGDALANGFKHDAFDIYRLLDCGGDWTQALNWNEEITKMNQDAWKRSSGAKQSKQTGEHGKLVFSTKRGWSLVKHSAAAKALREGLTDLAFSDVAEKWYSYRGGKWTPLSDQRARNRIDRAIDSETYIPNAQNVAYNSSYVEGVSTQLRGHLGKDLDTAPRHLLPFQNGVLDLRTLGRRDHDIGDGFTWQLPFDYDAQAGCEAFKTWLLVTVGNDPQMVRLLRAAIKAIVTGRSDFQRYIELIGPGGSGKGTFTRAIEALMGQGNTHVTELKHLEGNRFETAKLHGKRLCLITDAEKYSGDVSVLKAMTGGDSLRFEEKYRQSGEPFRFGGMALISANQDICSSDYTSGLERRRVTIRFDNVVDPKDRRDLDAEFAPLIPGILNWALAMPDEEMRKLIVETDRYISGASIARIDRLIKTNPVAAWADDELAYQRGAKTGIGINRPGLLGKPEHADEWLYANYCDWCSVNGHRKPLAVNSFVPILRDLLAHQLRLPGIEHKAEKKGKVFYGVRFRGDDESRDLSPLRWGLQESQGDESVTSGYESVTSGYESVTSQVTNETRVVTKVTDFPIKNSINNAPQPVKEEDGECEKNKKISFVSSKARNLSNGAALRRNRAVTHSSPSPITGKSPSPIEQIAEMLPELSSDEVEAVFNRLAEQDLEELMAGEVSAETLRCVAEGIRGERR